MRRKFHLRSGSLKKINLCVLALMKWPRIRRRHYWSKVARCLGNLSEERLSEKGDYERTKSSQKRTIKLESFCELSLYS